MPSTTKTPARDAISIETRFGRDGEIIGMWAEWLNGDSMADRQVDYYAFCEHVRGILRAQGVTPPQFNGAATFDGGALLLVD